ncbi:hypothetical protein [Xanthomonas bromi]|uniref:hypothetical protein n=1 Tax=Xanthomonas bromi TaxID=56449 RepID=UPI0011122F97|nr:hypothetical protein [Xanthomonas bromi]
MKNKFLSLIIPLAIGIFSVNAMAMQASSNDEIRESNPAQDVVVAKLLNNYNKQQKVIRKNAQVHSDAQLAAYVAGAKHEESPLNLLSPQAQMRFVNSLKFNEGGVSSFYYADIESELSSSQAYDLLSVFGLQSSLRFMGNIRVDTQRDREVIRAFGGREEGIDVAPPTDHNDYECTGRGTCHEAVGSICTSNC